MTNITVLVLMFSAVSTAMAGNEGGAGGNGFIINGKPYLLDFVEHGIEESPYFDDSLKSHRNYTKILETVQKVPFAPFQDSEVASLITLKLLEIGKVDALLANAYLAAFNKSEWYIVNKQLIDAWRGRTDIDVSDRFQLAIRRVWQIRITKSYYEQMDAANKVGLLFHEASISLIRPYATGTYRGVIIYKLNIDVIRRVVAQLFMKRFSDTHGQSLDTIAVYPTIPRRGATYFEGDAPEKTEGWTNVELKANGQKISLDYNSDLEREAQNLCSKIGQNISDVRVTVQKLTWDLSTPFWNADSYLWDEMLFIEYGSKGEKNIVHWNTTGRECVQVVKQAAKAGLDYVSERDAFADLL